MMYKAGGVVAAAAAAISSIIGSWLIPSSLFIFINLVICTILIISHFTSTSPKALIHDSLQLIRSPPSLLDRLSSFNYQSPQTTESTQPQLVSPPSLLERVKSFNLGLLYKHQETEHTSPASENPDNNPQEPKLALAPLLLQQLQPIKEPEPGSEMEGLESKMSESGSDDDDDDDDDDGKWLKEEKEIGVKADDFINMFKNQLRLQRVDSFNAYRDMLN